MFRTVRATRDKDYRKYNLDRFTEIPAYNSFGHFLKSYRIIKYDASVIMLSNF